MQKPQNWETVEAAAEFGGFESLELGGHIVVIKKAYEYTGMTGNTSLRIEVDIASGDQKDYFQKQFDNNTNADKKWPNGAIKYISLSEEEKNVAMFKGFITTVENSNAGYKWNFEEKTLVGKKLVGVFGLEEYTNNKGELKTSTKLTQFRSLDKLSEVRVPRVKLLNGTFVAYEEYVANKNKNSIEKTFGEYVNIADNDFDLD